MPALFGRCGDASKLAVESAVGERREVHVSLSPSHFSEGERVGVRGSHLRERRSRNRHVDQKRARGSISVGADAAPHPNPLPLQAQGERESRDFRSGSLATMPSLLAALLLLAQLRSSRHDVICCSSGERLRSPALIPSAASRLFRHAQFPQHERMRCQARRDIGIAPSRVLAPTHNAESRLLLGVFSDYLLRPRATGIARMGLARTHPVEQLRAELEVAVRRPQRAPRNIHRTRCEAILPGCCDGHDVQ